MPHKNFDYLKLVTIWLDVADKGGSYADVFRRMPEARVKNGRNVINRGNEIRLKQAGIFLPRLVKESDNTSIQDAQKLVARFQEDQIRQRRRGKEWER